MNNYKLVENYRDNEILRNSFNDLVEKSFSGLNFKEWYEIGYWTNKYIPYSLVKDNRIISNVSISKMNIIIEGKPVNGIQFGTVGTLPEYRKQGLSNYLMEYVLDKYESTTDLFFLFANESVLDFYPKFGFERKTESFYKLESVIPKSNYSAKKLSLNNASNFELIKGLLSKRQPLTSIFGARDYDFITVWHMIYEFPENVFYLEDEDIIVFYSVKLNQMHVWDVIYSRPFDFQNTLSKIVPDKNTKSIIFHFPPDDINFEYDEIIEDKESMLFVKGNFPLKGKQFKFPTTAQT
jgi:predicted N-acetyltransferase YhbS